MPDPDLLHRFLFEKSGIRGNLVHLDARQYRFDPIDIGQLFAETSRHATPTAQH